MRKSSEFTDIVKVPFYSNDRLSESGRHKMVLGCISKVVFHSALKSNQKDIELQTSDLIRNRYQNLIRFIT